MISSTNINGTQYKVSSEGMGTHSVSALPEGLRVHISTLIQHGLAKNKSMDEIMGGIVVKGQDGQYYLTTNHEDLLLAIEPEVVEDIKSIITGDPDEI